jgi:hypothetical protein
VPPLWHTRLTVNVPSSPDAFPFQASFLTLSPLPPALAPQALTAKRRGRKKEALAARRGREPQSVLRRPACSTTAPRLRLGVVHGPSRVLLASPSPLDRGRACRVTEIAGRSRRCNRLGWAAYVPPENNSGAKPSHEQLSGGSCIHASKKEQHSRRTPRSEGLTKTSFLHLHPTARGSFFKLFPERKNRLPRIVC